VAASLFRKIMWSSCPDRRKEALAIALAVRDLPAAARTPRVFVSVCRPDRNVVLVSGIRFDTRLFEVDDGRGIGIVRIRRVLLAHSYGS
jgi:hypothetical protein